MKLIYTRLPHRRWTLYLVFMCSWWVEEHFGLVQLNLEEYTPPKYIKNDSVDWMDLAQKH